MIENVFRKEFVKQIFRRKKYKMKIDHTYMFFSSRKYEEEWKINSQNSKQRCVKEAQYMQSTGSGKKKGTKPKNKS